MNEGWKQVWRDIRHALGMPPPEEQEGRGVETRLGQEIEAQESQVDPTAQLNQEAVEQSGQNTEAEAPAIPLGASPLASQAPSSTLTTPTQAAATLPLLAPLAAWLRDRRPAALVAGLALALLGTGALFLARSRAADPVPPAPNVVATYAGGQITIEDIRQHLTVLVPSESMRDQFQSIQGYRLLVEEILTDELVRRWAAERNVDRDESFQHAMKHITEEINLDELHTQMHEGRMGVTEGDIRAYYEANREQFGDRTLTQVRDQVRATLQVQQEDEFVQNYIDGLREKASITRNFDLLDVPEPEDWEIQTSFEANLERFVLPAEAVVDEIRITVGQDVAAAEEQANKAQIRLRSGEEFAAVAGDVSETLWREQGLTVVKGQREAAYDEVVFGLDDGQTSEVFRAGDAFYIVRLRSGQPERQRSLDEVRAQVRQAVLAEEETSWFQEAANRTLFTIHGERYTVGEFWQEYQELPLAFLADYQGPEGRRALAERLIQRLLLVEDTDDKLLGAANPDELDEVRLEVLAKMMEQEEVDDKIAVTDAELQAFYEQHEHELVEPPQSRIRQIMIRLGQTEDERKRAWEKATEAYQKLVPGLFRSGADFATVAREYSEDEATANQGGNVDGWVGEEPDLLAELFDHPFHQRIINLTQGEISRPFERNGAIYIVEVLDRTEPRPLPFDEVKEPLREALRLQKHDDLTAQLSQRLLQQADVTVYDQTLQTLVEEQGGG